MNKKVIKRNGKEVNFDEEKIRRVIKLANNNKDVPEEKRMNEEQIEKVFQAAIKKLEPMNNVKVEDIQDIVENSLMLKNHYEIARSYILFRNEKKKNKKFTDTEEKIISVIDGTNESVKQDNANKNPDMLPTQRDYMAGTISKELVKKTWSKTIMNLHNKGVIHIHDTDYRAMRMTNCCLVNLKYMFEHGFMLNSTFIHTPSGFFVACTQATQIAQHVCSQQYGGQTMSWAHIAPFVNKSRIKFIEEVKKQLEEAGISASEEQIKNIAESRVLDEIKRGVKTVQYQILTLSGTNGQSPFISMAINFEECENKQERDDLLLITEEVFRQRLRGVEDEHGNRVSAIFPKILFFLDEYTAEGGEYFDRLMPLICECENNRMSPDFISTKIQKKLKNNSVGYPSMGCRSFLTTEGQYIEDGQIKKCNENFYGRHNNGVITINLPYVALEARKTYEEMLNNGLEASLNSIFFDKLDEYLEIIYNEGFVQTYNRLKGTKAKVAPILWVWGALAHLDPEDVIDSLIAGWRSTYSLGYVGLWETSIAITGKDHVEDSSFAKSILEFFNKKHEEWHKRLMIEGDENSFLNTSSYGTPEENTTEKFANALKRDFDIIKGVNDHGFVTNSYHIIPSYSPNKDGRGIDAFRKLEHESQFLNLSTGGAVSYVEIADMEDNLPVIEAVINHMYNTILYAEFNIRKHMCYNCGYSGEIPLVRNEYGKLLYKCPSCGNIDTSKMNILTRACGYVFNAANGAAQGRYEDIFARLLNLGGGRTYNQFGKIEM